MAIAAAIIPTPLIKDVLVKSIYSLTQECYTRSKAANFFVYCNSYGLQLNLLCQWQLFPVLMSVSKVSNN